ncbi:cysteine proteinase inhibitor 8-like [Wolffia australiana]
MENRSKLLHLLPVLVALLLVALPNGGDAALFPLRIIRGYQPIRDLDAAENKTLAHLDLAQYNELFVCDMSLNFNRVLAAQQQVVMAMNYNLFICTRPRTGIQKLCEVSVYDGLSPNECELSRFKPKI